MTSSHMLSWPCRPEPDRAAPDQFLLWLCDQIEGEDQPSPAWLIGPDVAQWTVAEIKQVGPAERTSHLYFTACRQHVHAWHSASCWQGNASRAEHGCRMVHDMLVLTGAGADGQGHAGAWCQKSSGGPVTIHSRRRAALC